MPVSGLSVREPGPPTEFADLKSQFATSSWGGRRKLPLAFTEHGAIMAATVLNTPRAVEVSVWITASDAGTARVTAPILLLRPAGRHPMPRRD